MSMMEGQLRTLRDVSATRVLRSELLAMATAAARARPGQTETLRLVCPSLSESRIEKEWGAAADALRPKVLERLSLQVVFPDGRTRIFGAHQNARLDRAPIERGIDRDKLRLPQRDLAFAVEKLLVWAWLTRKGPLTRKWLERTAGCTYPTVAAVVRRLGSALRRHPDRRIEVTHVPRGEWVRLFGISGEARSTLRLADVSDQRSDPARLLRRLTQAAPAGVAVGGVAGAHHYHRQLDLVGLPRLDLSVHAPGRDAVIGFVRRLDPALTQVTDPAAPAVVVLHFVRHKEALVVPHPAGLPWADPVECILDLHEAGLQAQASELLEALTPPASA
jgi:hypothetical protein